MEKIKKEREYLSIFTLLDNLSHYVKESNENEDLNYINGEYKWHFIVMRTPRLEEKFHFLIESIAE